MLWQCTKKLRQWVMMLLLMLVMVLLFCNRFVVLSGSGDCGSCDDWVFLLVLVVLF